MVWKKVKDWFKGLFKKEVKETVVNKNPDVIEKRSSELEKVVRERMALSPADLVEPEEIVEEVPECDHRYVIKQQAWIRIAAKKFELQNEVFCIVCKDNKTVPIG